MTRPVMLRAETSWVRSASGVLIRTAAGEFDIPGASIADWLDALTPLLDGSRTEPEILVAVPAGRRATAARVLSALRRRDIVRSVPVSALGDRTEGALWEYHLEDPARVVADGMRVVVVGDPGNPSSTLGSRIVEALHTAGMRSARSDTAVAADTDAVVHVVDSSRIEAHDPVQRRCEQRGLPVAVVVLADTHAWLRPTAPVDEDHPGLVDMWRRRSIPPTSGRVGSAAGLRVLAAQVARDVSWALAGLPPREPAVRLLRMDLRTLETRPCSPCFVPAAARPVGDPADDAEFARRLSPLQDSEFGAHTPIETVVDGHGGLHVAHTTVADPLGVIGYRPRVTGFGTDPGTAWQRAARRALVIHALSSVDDGSRAAPEMRARDVVSGAVRWVPTAAVLPAAGAASWEPVGAAAGATRAEALLDGLLQHCRTLLTVAGSRDLPEITMGDAPLDVTGAQFAELAAAGSTVRVLDASTILGVPATWCTSGGHHAVGVGTSFTRALTDANLGLLLARRGYTERTRPSEHSPAGTACPPRQRVGTDEIARALAGAGHRVSVVDLDHDPWVAAVAPHVLRVVSER